MPEHSTVTVERAGTQARPVLAALMQMYLHDLSAVEQWEVDETGSFGDNDLDRCWSDPRRHPFLIRSSGRIAGFAIVDEGSRARTESADLDMAEFFILRRWRRHGVGRSAFAHLTARFPGRWQVRPFPGGGEATTFWQTACAELADGAGVTRSTFQRRGRPAPMLTFTVGSRRRRPADPRSCLPSSGPWERVT